jgi:transcriptional antiterminator NusG
MDEREEGIGPEAELPAGGAPEVRADEADTGAFHDDTLPLADDADHEPEQAEPGDDEPEDDESGDDEPEDDESGDDEPEDDEPEDDEPEDDEPEDDESGDDESGDDEPEDDRAGEGEASEGEAADRAQAEAQPADAGLAGEDGPHWYFVHCYSGQENKVRHNLEQRIASMGMKGKIVDVIVPTEEEIEVKDGKRRTIERRVYPGYILVNMVMNEETWYVVRNTPGVTGFVGMGNTPTPLRPEEVSNIIKRMEAEAPKVKVTFKTGQKVRIVDGPFNDIIGTVADIDMDRTKVRVMVSFFGRETPVELDFLQVEKV